MIPEYIELAKVITTAERYGFIVDMEDYSYILIEYEIENIPKTIFKNVFEKNTI
jgi:hypothetical protein